MTKSIISAAILISMFCYGCSNDNNNHRSAKSNKDKVVERLNSMQTGDPASNAYMNPDKYIQHNLAIADGHEGFEAVISSLPVGTIKVRVVRVFEDGDYVFAHTEYDFFGPQIGIDIFRFENNLIVEHWDNLQIIEGPNPSGHSMIDGETRLTDKRKTGENKALAGQFVNEVLIGQNLGVLAGYFNSNNLQQHNPSIGDGVPAWRTALTEMFASGVRYDRIHKILGEGNFVLVVSEGIRTVSEGVITEQPVSFYNLFRLADDRIVEHWDVVEDILPESQWQNQNGKFNFPY